VPGLSEYLINQVSLDSVLLRTSVTKLTILPVGRPPHNPAELLSSNLMSELLEELKERYSDRYIIIDSPPPQIMAESNALARRVDGILLVVKHGSTPRKTVKSLMNILEKEKILGVIVNWFDGRSEKYGNYGKYAVPNK
jgi:capsular exopolysaccharide synthesis family protein